jgi:hypothetical protein
MLNHLRAHALPLFFLVSFVIAAVVALDAVHAFAEAPATAYAKYHSDRWHFTIPVPADMKFDEHDGPGDSQTIQFTDATADKTFEVSAEPYTQMDVALGEEGAPNASSDQSTTLGIINVYHADTLAFAFHRNGVAYTVTTLPENESWLLPILQSWEFTDK